jgi:hypothetical protein
MMQRFNIVMSGARDVKGRPAVGRGGSSPRTAATSRRIARRPASTKSTGMVVRDGDVKALKSASSQPVTTRSPGTDQPRSAAPRSTPSAT